MAAQPSRPPVNCRSAPELSGSRVEDRAATPPAPLTLAEPGPSSGLHGGPGDPHRGTWGCSGPVLAKPTPVAPQGRPFGACRASGSASTPSNTSSNRYRPECYHPHRIASPPSTQLDEAARYLSVGPTPRVRLGLPRSRESTRATRGERALPEPGAAAQNDPQPGPLCRLTEPREPTPGMWQYQL